MSQKYANWKLEQKVIGTMQSYHFPLYPNQPVLEYIDVLASIV